MEQLKEFFCFFEKEEIDKKISTALVVSETYTDAEGVLKNAFGKIKKCGAVLDRTLLYDVKEWYGYSWHNIASYLYDQNFYNKKDQGDLMFTGCFCAYSFSDLINSVESINGELKEIQKRKQYLQENRRSILNALAVEGIQGFPELNEENFFKLDDNKIVKIIFDQEEAEVREVSFLNIKDV